MQYEKAEAEVVYFTNRDVITASGAETGCRVHGWDMGNGCDRTSGKCPGKQAA